MAKLLRLQLINALIVFIFFLLVSTEMAMAEVKLCQKRSQTWTGVCIKTGNCDNQCKSWESAFHGACHRQGLGFACFCYFKC